MERRLRDLDPQLHRRFTDTVFGLQYILSNYKLLFPKFTDHTELHSLSVIDFCNHLIGDQIGLMNADEIYALLVGCYFHDTGMGISEKDYVAFSKEIDFGDYFDTHSREDIPGIIRDFHNEYSGLFIRKYAPFFEIPSKEHLWAVIEIARGHRKTSLMDEDQYPLALKVPGGGTICLPYLTALIRLSDEIDVTAARNPALLYDLESITEEPLQAARGGERARGHEGRVHYAGGDGGRAGPGQPLPPGRQDAADIGRVPPGCDRQDSFRDHTTEDPGPQDRYCIANTSPSTAKYSFFIKF